MDYPIFNVVVTLIIGIIGFLSKTLITDLKKTIDKMQDEINSHDTSIKLLESRNGALDRRIDRLFDAIKELSLDIKELTKELSNKKDRD